MSFEPRCLEADNPADVAEVARTVVLKLEGGENGRASVADLQDQYFHEDSVPDEVVLIAAEALAVHPGSPIECEDGELVLANEHEIREYRKLIGSAGPDDPVDLLKIHDRHSDAVADLNLVDPVSQT